MFRKLIDTVKDIAGALYGSEEQQPARTESGNAFQENVLSGWVSGRLQGPELAERAGIAGINIFSRIYRVLCLKETGGNAGLHALVQDTETALSAVCDCSRFTNANAVHVLVLGGSMVDLAAVRERMQTVINENRQSLAVFGAMGVEASGSAEVPISYRSACDLLNFSMLFPKNTIIFFRRSQACDSQHPRSGQ